MNQPPKPPPPQIVRVEVVDLDVSFGTLVALWFKVVFAAVPVLITLGILYLLVVVAGLTIHAAIRGG